MAIHSSRGSILVTLQNPSWATALTTVPYLLLGTARTWSSLKYVSIVFAVNLIWDEG